MILSHLKTSCIHEDISESDIYEKNTNYINEHKYWVMEAYKWLRENCLELFNDIDESEFADLIAEHDESKFSKEEFKPYAEKWFGNSGKTPEYEAAWEHHWKNNKHHPEYWGGKDMPVPFIIEMLCDWLSFGLKQNNPAEIISFYKEKAKDDPEKNLSKATKTYIENFLSMLNNINIDADAKL